MAVYLLDSDALVDYLNAYLPTMQLLEELLTSRNVLATNAIVIAEVFSGLSLPKRVEAQPFVDGLAFLELTAAVAKRAGELRYNAARRGVSLGIADVLVAATALEQFATVVSGNVRHFEQTGVPLLPLPRPTR